MGFRDFLQDSTPRPQSNQPGPTSRTPALLLLGPRPLPIQHRYQIAVAQAADRMLRIVHCFQQSRVFGSERVQRSYVAPQRRARCWPTPTQWFGNFFQRRRGPRGGGSGGVTLVGRLAHLRTSVQVGHAATHDAPLLLSLRIRLTGTKRLELASIVDGRFNAYDPVTIVHLDGVAVHPVLNAHALFASAHIAADFAFEALTHLPAQRYRTAQKAHHVGALIRRDGDRKSVV